MSRLRAAHDPFVVDGGCTCPGHRTLFQLRIKGHTADCTEARRRAVEEARRQRQEFERLPSVNGFSASTNQRLRDAG